MSKNKEIELAKNEKNVFKAQQVQFQKSRKLPDFLVRVFGQFNSYSFKFNSGIVLWTMTTDPAIEMSEACVAVRGENPQFVWSLKLDLLWFEYIFLMFGLFDFFVFWRA